MEYSEVLQYMNRRWKSGVRLGLTRIRALLEHTRALLPGERYIHVAGTNGKGSTVACIASMLANCGLRVGVYTSPYLERFTDRIRVLDGPAALRRRLRDSAEGEITPAELAALFTELRRACDRIVAAGGEDCSEFEVLTAAALLHFKRRGCDAVVLETGLGGRLDATNAIPYAAVSVITALGLDHCAYLGESLREIAGEKAAIIKRGSRCAVVYDPWAAGCSRAESASVYACLAARCAEQDVPLRVVGRGELRGPWAVQGGERFFFGADGPFLTPLCGAHQALNAAVALAAVSSFLAGRAPRPAAATPAEKAPPGSPSSPSSAVCAPPPDFPSSAACAPPPLREGLALTRWPGRLEALRYRGRLLIMDGAHNPQAARVLGRALRTRFPGRSWGLLLAVMADKDYRAILASLRDALGAPPLRVVCCAPDNARALAPAALAAALREVWKDHPQLAIMTAKSVAEALDLAVAGQVREGLAAGSEDGAEGPSGAARRPGRDEAGILACGSLYLISELKDRIRREE